MDWDLAVKDCLGSIKHISGKDASEFKQGIGKYVDSRGKKQIKGSKDVAPVIGSERIEPELYPLIRKVKIGCPAKALSTGIVLVDLPGTQDTNAARAAIPEEYMKSCDRFRIPAPITRAVNDQSAKCKYSSIHGIQRPFGLDFIPALLRRAFRLQLFSAQYLQCPGSLNALYHANTSLRSRCTVDGNYDANTITFVATKTDDISCSEIISTLRLDEDERCQEIRTRIEECKNAKKLQKNRKIAAQVEKKTINGELKTRRAALADLKRRIKGEANVAASGMKRKRPDDRSTGPKSKRARNGHGDMTFEVEAWSSSHEKEEAADSDISDGSDEDGPSCSDVSDDDKFEDCDGSDNSDEGDVTMEEMKAILKLRQEEVDGLAKALEAVNLAAKVVTNEASMAEKNRRKAQKDLDCFCAKSRNEYTQERLKQDFRAGLKDMDDQTLASQANAADFDPNTGSRDYDTVVLPTFTVSSRDYMRIKGLVGEDGDVSCFSDLADI
ncbi:hypothetical protein FRB94_000607 [Tulasnella sp. JGI-2019a]|nr:hypothetical protein FRB94_000607 [Tulasnella sp. JGI-2019a]